MIESGMRTNGKPVCADFSSPEDKVDIRVKICWFFERD